MSALQRMYDGTALRAEIERASVALQRLSECHPWINGKCMCCGEPESDHDRQAHLGGCPYAIAEEMGR